jgi:hypothetical protein
MPEAAGADRIADRERVCVQRRPAVGAVAAHQGGGDRHFEGSYRVQVDDGPRGLHEDPVRVGGGADVDLDTSPQPVDVCTQQRVVG